MLHSTFHTIPFRYNPKTYFAVITNRKLIVIELTWCCVDELQHITKEIIYYFRQILFWKCWCYNKPQPATTFIYFIVIVYQSLMANQYPLHEDKEDRRIRAYIFLENKCMKYSFMHILFIFQILSPLLTNITGTSTGIYLPQYIVGESGVNHFNVHRLFRVWRTRQDGGGHCLFNLHGRHIRSWRWICCWKFHRNKQHFQRV